MIIFCAKNIFSSHLATIVTGSANPEDVLHPDFSHQDFLDLDVSHPDFLFWTQTFRNRMFHFGPKFVEPWVLI